MAVAALGQPAPSSPVRARAVLTTVANDAISGFFAETSAATEIFDGTSPARLAILTWFWSFVTQAPILPASFILSLLPVFGTLNVSPPSGATGVSDADLPGIGTVAQWRSGNLASAGNCHGPL